MLWHKLSLVSSFACLASPLNRDCAVTQNARKLILLVSTQHRRSDILYQCYRQFRRLTCCLKYTVLRRPHVLNRCLRASVTSRCKKVAARSLIDVILVTIRHTPRCVALLVTLCMRRIPRGYATIPDADRPETLTLISARLLSRPWRAAAAVAERDSCRRLH